MRSGQPTLLPRGDRGRLGLLVEGRRGKQHLDVRQWQRRWIDERVGQHGLCRVELVPDRWIGRRFDFGFDCDFGP
ncbi:MAG: hypothetical protein ACE37F_21215 [Nannocystaceae bacterium]|nr:hypothetical protein [bacterium]